MSEKLLSQLLEGIKQDIKADLSSMSKTLANIDIQLDDLKNEIKEVEQKCNDKFMKTAIRMIDMDVYSRKWNLMFFNIPGDSGNENTTTTLIDFGSQYLKLNTKAEPRDFGACHRLSQSPNAPIIARFHNLEQRNLWYSHARNLKGVTLIKDKTSGNDKYAGISPNLPKVLTKIRDDVFQRRQKLSTEERKKSQIRYLPSYPYILLSVNGVAQTTNTTKHGLAASFFAEE